MKSLYVCICACTFPFYFRSSFLFPSAQIAQGMCVCSFDEGVCEKLCEVHAFLMRTGTRERVVSM